MISPHHRAALSLLPKVDLHFHMSGTLRPTTLEALARKYDMTLPRRADVLYVYRDFYEFMDVLQLVSKVMRSADDFARVSYEAIEDAFKTGNARHVEMSFNPQYFMDVDVPYQTQLDGLVAGIEAAEHDFPVSAVLLASLDRGLGLRSGDEAMRDIVELRHERVVGVGLDGPERSAAPATLASLFQRATRAGLKKTAHVCEDNQTLAEAPPSNVDACMEILHCDRLDHGYNVMADAAAVQRARDRGTWFCVCGVTCVAHRMPKRLEVVKQMVEAGLQVTLNTDDPAMYHTNLSHTYETVLDGCGWGWEEAKAFSLAGVDACWLDAGAKRALREDFERQIAELEAPWRAPSN